MALGLRREVRDELWGVLGRDATARHLTVKHSQRIRLNAPAAIVAEVSDPALEEGHQHGKIGSAIGHGAQAVDLQRKIRQGEIREKAP